IFPQWSADGQSLVFESIHPREIREVPVAGGSPRTLYRPPAQSDYYTSVGRDGRILFMEAAAGGAKLEALNPRTGNTQDLATLAAGFEAQLCWSPDQRQVAYETPAGIALTDFHGPARQIFAGRAGLACTPGGVYALQAKPDLSAVLWKIPWNGAGPTQVSTAIQPLWDLNYQDVGVGNYFAISPDGRQAVFQVEPQPSANLGLLTQAPNP
ncbi:MAG: TolB family protein, partial [Terriglobales bacterium]